MTGFSGTVEVRREDILALEFINKVELARLSLDKGAIDESKRLLDNLAFGMKSLLASLE